MLELVVKIVMALAVVGFVGYPLLRVEDDEQEAEFLSEEAEELYRRKESTYSAIKELEFDWRTGKLSEEDFRELDAKYRAEAVEILEAIDLLESGDRKATEAKAAARTSPAKASAAGGAAAKKAKAKGPSAEPATLTALVCAECGQTNRPGSRFCGSCGSALTAEVEQAAGNGGARAEGECPDCGSSVQPGHKFCASCGAEVRA